MPLRSNSAAIEKENNYERSIINSLQDLKQFLSMKSVHLSFKIQNSTFKIPKGSGDYRQRLGRFADDKLGLQDLRLKFGDGSFTFNQVY